jgi:hypothetical protein
VQQKSQVDEFLEQQEEIAKELAEALTQLKTDNVFHSLDQAWQEFAVTVRRLDQLAADEKEGAYQAWLERLSKRLAAFENKAAEVERRRSLEKERQAAADARWMRIILLLLIAGAQAHRATWQATHAATEQEQRTDLPGPRG